MTTDTGFLSDIMDRLAAMEKEALSAFYADADDVGVLDWPDQQTVFPYWTNRVGPYDLTFEYGEDVPTDNFTVLMRLVGGHVGEGYEGEPQSNLHQWILAVMNFFEDRPFLTSASYATDFDFVDPLGALLMSHTGVVVFQNAGTLASQLGCEFTLTLPALRQAY